MRILNLNHDTFLNEWFCYVSSISLHGLPCVVIMCPVLHYMHFPVLCCRSLSPLFDNPKLDRELRGMVREHFADFCSQDGESGQPAPFFGKMSDLMYCVSVTNVDMIPV